jgi:hypothetical protein
VLIGPPVRSSEEAVLTVEKSNLCYGCYEMLLWLLESGATTLSPDEAAVAERRANPAQRTGT